MSDFDDLPIIQFRPGQTDAELAAQRDAQHIRDVAEWFAEQRRMFDFRAVQVYVGTDHIPARQVRG